MKPQVRRAVYAAHQRTQDTTTDTTTDEDIEDDLKEKPRKDEKKLEVKQMKSRKREEEEETEEKDAKPSSNLLTQAPAPVVTPPSKRRKVPLTKSMILCAHCFNEDCHAYRYGKFLAFLTHARYNGNFEEEKENLKEQFKQAYHSVREWDKVVKFQEGNPRPIDSEDVNEDLPACVLRFRNMWLNKLKTRFNNANGTFADPFK